MNYLMNYLIYQIIKFSDVGIDGYYGIKGRFYIIDDNGKEKNYITDKFKTFKPYTPYNILK